MAIAAAALATCACLLLLDLAWLGWLARGVYDGALASLKRDVALLPAAALFYAFYSAAVVWHAVLGAQRPAEAARRGAAMGLFAYGTYELTNWAVLRGWPLRLVALDVAWGVLLTGAAALAGRLAFERAQGRS